MNHSLDQRLATLALTLCHTQELIALAYQISCEMHPKDTSQDILRASGRLATLMHVAAQQITSAQAEAAALERSAKSSSAQHHPASGRHDH